MQTIFIDLLHAWRRALRQPGATLSVILLLALGMGGATAVFIPIYSTLFTPLPLTQPEQLMRIGGNIPLFDFSTSSFKNEEDLRRIFSNMMAYCQYQAKIQIPDTGKNLEVSAIRVSEGFFETLGVKPLMGYDLNSSGKRKAFLVSHRFWRDELLQKTDVIGGKYILDSSGIDLSIVGIMPENFNFPADIDIWEYVSIGKGWGGGLGETTYFVGRLHPGVSSGYAEKVLLSIDFQQKGQASNAGGHVLQSLQSFLYGDQKPLLMMLGVTAILFLVLVVVGVVNILIAQGIQRKQEIATRLIYGASRRNLVFQLLREILPLVIIGGLAGWWVAEIAGIWLKAQFPALHSGVVNVPVKITFWAALVIVVTFIGGLIPSLYATSINLNTYLKSASEDKRRIFASREVLVGVQLCLTLALLVCVGVLLRSMMFGIDIPIGWSARDVAVLSLDFSDSLSNGVADTSKAEAIFLDIRNAFSGMPEVMAVGDMAPIPFSAWAITRSQSSGVAVSKALLPQGQKPPYGSPSGIEVRVSPEGFGMLSIPLLAGRYFTEADTTRLLQLMKIREYGRDGGVVIINQALSQLLWPGENPVGKIFYANSESHEVVGVVRNFHLAPGIKDFIPAIYTPSIYAPKWTGMSFNYECLIKLRPDTSLAKFQSDVRQRLSGYTFEWLRMRPLSEEVASVIANQRMMLQLLSCFAVLGIIISGLGVYATATLMVAARNREMGIRIALGAQIIEIFRLAFWRGVRVILIGLPFGLFLALIMSKVLSSYLIYINVGDPLVWVISCAVLLFITIVAALIPALRVMCINPIDVLRNE